MVRSGSESIRQELCTSRYQSQLEDNELVQYYKIGSIKKWRVECSWGAAMSRAQDYHGIVVLALGRYPPAGQGTRFADSALAAGLIYLKPEAEVDAGTDLCTLAFGESKASMYVKYRSLIASFMVQGGRLEWSDRTRDDGSPQRLLNFEEIFCVTGALIAWSHDFAGQMREYETCDVQRRLAEGDGIRYIEDDHWAVVDESATTHDIESAQR